MKDACDVDLHYVLSMHSMQTHSSSNGSNKGSSGAALTNEAPTTQRGQKAADSKAAKKLTEPRMKCQWSPEEEERLILFLVSRKSEAGDGGSFKAPIWTAAAQKMAKFLTKGPNKTTTACSSKYGDESLMKLAVYFHD